LTELSIDRKEIQEKMDWIVNQFAMNPEIKKWAEDVDIQLRMTGVEDELSVSKLIEMINLLSRALWGMCHYEKNWEDYANCKTDTPYHIAERMKNTIEERRENLKEHEHFKHYWLFNHFDEEKVQWLMNRNEGECDIRDSFDIYYEFRQNPYAAIKFLNTCTEDELSKLKQPIELLMKWFGDSKGENELIACLEALGRLKSEEIFNMVKEFKEKQQWSI
jgi:hypothetical protein